MILYDTFIKQPKEVQLTDGRKIKHYYDGAGTLLKTIYYTATNTVLETWDFVGNMIYKNGQPYQMTTPEGRATYNAGVWTYEFDYKDHLGNTRVSFKANGQNLEKTAETAFDPWGVRMNIGVVNAFQDRFEMQNHEKESTFGLNRINFGARTANPTTGRFDRIDSFSEKREWLSPYNYVQNNPILRIDPNGNLDDYSLAKNGEVTLKKETNDNFDKLTATNGESITVSKPNSEAKTIISDLSTQNEGFSVAKSSDLTQIKKIYDFMDKNTTRGIEFGLTGYLNKGKMDYSISTMHRLLETSYNKLNIKPESLVFYIHNHDGGSEYSDADFNLVRKLSNDLVKKSAVFYPRFFTLSNNELNEYDTRATKNLPKVQFDISSLQKIKKFNYDKRFKN